MGILNYRHQRDTTRPRLVVRPCVYSLVDRDARETEHNVGVMQVCNVGHVPVIGSGIGFKPRKKGENGHLIVSPQSINGQELTQELKPGHVAMLRFELDGLPDTGLLGPAQVWTIVGDSFTASRRDMRKFAEDRTAAKKSSD